MYPRLVVPLMFTALVAGGCSRAKITTEIKPDGAWVRTVTLTGKDKKEGMQAPALEESFVFPSGSGWTTKEEKKSDDRIMIFERTLAAGAVLKGDLSLKGDQPDKPSLSNEVSVSRPAPRRFEYRETLRWTGKAPEGMGKIKPQDLADIKASLPKALATDENTQALVNRTAALVVPLFFGPGDPCLAIGMLHPDLAERRMTQRIGAVLVKALEDQFGGKLTPAERHAVAARLVTVHLSSTKPSAPDPSAGPPTGNNSGLTPLLFVLRTPGKVVSTNGERDDFAGEIYWALYPEAALLKEVTLTAVCELEGK